VIKHLRHNWNDMNTARKATTVRLPEYLLADLHTEANRRNISVSRLLEDIVEEKMYPPNAETLAAIEECRSGVEMEDFDPDELDQYIYAEEAEEVHAV
ncbi:MAG: hypothetical protein J6Y87_06110, partial [Muribaculaceae bacterium]|nr:hypothetical protein [Muribaculaceae bacterium]